MQLMYGKSLASAFLSVTLLVYTVPAPVYAQLPQLPKAPEVPKPPALPQAAPPAGPDPTAAPPAGSQARMPDADEQPPFHITVVEGEGAINNIHQQVNRAATVIVEDENKNPLSGVAVTFFLPNDGPSGLFPNGSKVLTVFTDDKGIATSRTVRFNNLVGIMPIRVSASLFSQSVNATITQTNVASGQAIRSYVSPVTRNQEPAKHGIHVSKKAVIIAVAVGAAVAVGVVFATKTTPPSASVGGPATTGPITIH